MDDLISRQAAIEAFICEGSVFVYGRDTCKAIVSRLMQIPSAEPEITRCKDCIYFDRYVDGIEKYQWDGFCADWARNTYEDWYCSRAERRTDD